MARYPTGLLEEELKNKVAADWFAAYYLLPAGSVRARMRRFSRRRESAVVIRTHSDCVSVRPTVMPVEVLPFAKLRLR